MQAERRPALLTVLLAWWAVPAFLVAAVLVTVAKPYAFRAPDYPAIRSDGEGYHLWTRALLDRRLSFCDYRGLLQAPAVSQPTPADRCANIYPPGLALLRFPVMAPFTAVNHGALRSPAEDAVSDLCALLAGAVAVGSMVALARRLDAPRGYANLAAVLVTFGTGLFHYSTLDGTFAHAYLAAGIGLFGLLLLDEVLPDPGIDDGRPSGRLAVVRNAGWFGIPLMLMLVRQTSLLPLLCLSATAATFVVRRSGWRTLLQRHRGPILLGGGGVLAAVVVQTAVNSYAYGGLQLSSYGGEYSFVAGQWQQLAVAFSPRKGAFLTYPIGLVAVAALVLARRRWELVAVVATTGALVLLYGSWFKPFLGGGFGHRGFVDLAPVWGAGLAAGLGAATPRARLMLSIAAVLSSAFTLGLMIAYWNGEVAFEEFRSSELVRYGLGVDSAPARLVRWALGSLL